jgi:carbon-monoxide dehydrogenase medium subunit
MMSLCETYIVARSVDQALQSLLSAPQPARLVAGGTDFLLELQQGLQPPVSTLVDITQVEEMLQIQLRQDKLLIGASVNHNRIANSPLVQQHAQALAEACGLVGGPQVRNMGTIGGNVAHSLPAADGTIALLALDAQAEIASLAGRRLAPLSELFLGPGKSALHPQNDLLVSFHLPLCLPGQASAFARIMRPQGVAIAILNMAIWLERRGEEISRARIAVGPSGPIPLRMYAAEQLLTGQRPDQPVLRAAMDALLGEAHFRSSRHRATSEYRRHLAGVLLEDVLLSAWRRAQAD